MSTVVKKHYTLEEYFELERLSEEKYQYLDGEVFPVGESPRRSKTSDDDEAHRLITDNLHNAIKHSLAKRQAMVYGRETPILLPNGFTLNADVVVSLPSDASSTSPVMIAEVLSDATESYDRGRKFQHYQSIPAFQEYVLVAQDRPHVDHFVREPDGSWRLRMINGMDSMLQLSSVGCKVAFRAIFDGVAFPPEAEPAADL